MRPQEFDVGELGGQRAVSGQLGKIGGAHEVSARQASDRLVQVAGLVKSEEPR